jgi:hypothetical protein
MLAQEALQAEPAVLGKPLRRLVTNPAIRFEDFSRALALVEVRSMRLDKGR